MELSERTEASLPGRSARGESIESEASIVIIGDVRHGARVTAKGNIIVLGELRGSVHANVLPEIGEAVVAAMEMAPLQIGSQMFPAIMAIR
ncbi:MAG: septum site-determining protein MinC [Clostridium sp.]